MEDTLPEEPNERLVDRLRDMILDDVAANDYVNTFAQNSMNDFSEAFPGTELSEDAYKEMFRQHQTCAWFMLFNRMGNL